MNTGRATGFTTPIATPGQAKGYRKLLAAGLAILVLCTAGTVWFLFGDGPFLKQQATGLSRTGNTAKKPAARTTARTHAARQADATTAAQPLADATRPATGRAHGAGASEHLAGAAQTSATNALQDTRQDGLQDALQFPHQDGLPEPESLADFHPASVYSGTLGEMTRLQADQQIAKADLALKEVRAKLAKIERETAENAGEAAPGAAGLRERDERLTSLERRVQASLDEMLARLEKTEKGGGGVWQVLAVRGRNGALEAELLGSRGRRLVRVGDELETGLKVDEITRTNVRLAGRTLPWR